MANNLYNPVMREYVKSLSPRGYNIKSTLDDFRSDYEINSKNLDGWEKVWEKLKIYIIEHMECEDLEYERSPVKFFCLVYTVFHYSLKESLIMRFFVEKGFIQKEDLEEIKTLLRIRRYYDNPGLWIMHNIKSCFDCYSPDQKYIKG
jgi:hypothetical protein